MSVKKQPVKKKTKKPSGKTLFMVGVWLEAVSGYDPNRMQLWNMIGVFDSFMKAQDASASVATCHSLSTFIKEIKINEDICIDLHDGPWYESPEAVEPSIVTLEA